MVSESIDRVKYWRSKGKTIVLSFDDGYLQLKDNPLVSENPAVSFWARGEVTQKIGGSEYKKYIGYDPLEQFVSGMTHCSAATVPSKVLASDYRPYTNTFYLPNYLDAEKYIKAFNRRQKKHGEIWLGWGGSLGHHASWTGSGILEALREVLRERERVKFLLVGDQRLIPKLKLPKDKLIFRPYVPYFRWANTIQNFDISLAPLHSKFDLRRSFIKAGEASLAKLPFIATGDSEYPVYEEFYGSPAHIYVPSELTVPGYDDRVEHWYNALNQMIDNIEHYREATEESFEIGMRFDVDANVDNIIGVYEDIMELGL